MGHEEAPLEAIVRIFCVQRLQGVHDHPNGGLGQGADQVVEFIPNSDVMLRIQNLPFCVEESPGNQAGGGRHTRHWSLAAAEE
jgi:hypothetical protein